MNYPRIESQEYTVRVADLRARMAKADVDLVVGFSNLLELGIVRYYCGSEDQGGPQADPGRKIQLLPDRRSAAL